MAAAGEVGKGMPREDAAPAEPKVKRRSLKRNTFVVQMEGCAPPRKGYVRQTLQAYAKRCAVALKNTKSSLPRALVAKSGNR